MPSETEATSPEPEGLQFDHAEYENPEELSGVVCAGCKQEVADQYYEINGTIFCEPCRTIIESQLRGGSGFVRFLKAIVLGSGAALVGAAIYFSVYHFLHFEHALVSILCGFLVGKAVRIGSGNRGGWIYQILAILLTYLAIGMAYTGVLIAEGVPQAPANQAGPAPKNHVPIAAAEVVKVLTLVTVLSPVLVAKQNFISLIIILFALWEAWKFTKAAKLIVTGPYLIGDGDPEPGIEGVAGHA